MNRIVLAGGGTAGHVEPAIAVARQWQRTHTDDELIFLGTKSGLENKLVPEAGFSLVLITKVRISRSLSLSLLITPFSLFSSISQSMKVLKGADLLIGFGGYVSAPAYCAAFLRGVPIVIHEANAHPGFANRIGSLLTQFSAVAYPVSRGKLSRALLTGLPLKDSVKDAFISAESDWTRARHDAKTRLGFDSKKPLIFIFGGSQGSVAINSVVAQSRSALRDAGVQILHAVGAQNELPAADSAYIPSHYISDMAGAYLAADVVISRAGAVTCAEINTLGRFALFIPLPIGNGEQELNAQSLVSNGRAEIVLQKHFSPEWIAQNLSRLFTLSSSAPSQGSRQDIDAASKIVSLMEFAITGGK